MRSSILIVVAAALAVVAFSPAIHRPAPRPTPVAPAGPLASTLAAVAADDRAVLSSVYAALADAIEKDGTVIVSTATLADGTGRALDLAFRGRKLTGDGAVGEAIDKHIATALGWDAGAIPDVIVTPVLRGKVAAAYREIAAAAR